MNGNESDGAPLRVGVIGGGLSGEHEVSLASASAAAEALEQRRHRCERLTIGPDGRWFHAGTELDFGEAVALLGHCDVALPLVHGPYGEDGSLAALCGFAGVRTVGSGVAAGAIGMDKWTAKLVASAIGVATAPGVLVHAGEDYRAWTGPVVVKPVAAGSSIGVRVVDSAADLPVAVAEACAVGGRALVEELVEGREIDIAVLRLDDRLIVSAPLEISCEGLFNYAAKYDHGATFQVPAALTTDQFAALTASATGIFEAIGCRGVARVDFFLTGDGWVFNEINTVPGMTAASQVPLMFDAVGISYPNLMDALVRDAARSRPWFDAR